MPTQMTRAQLRNLFQSGAKPTSGDFADLIESNLNALEDGIFTQPGADDPIKLVAKGEESNLLDMYVDEAHFWRLNTQPSTTNSGLSFSYDGVSKLFVETSTGNLGLGTIDPEARVDAAGDIRAFGGKLIAGDDKTDTVALGHTSGGDAFLDIKGSGGLTIRTDGTDRVVLEESGNLGIGTAEPRAALDVRGAVFAGVDDVNYLETGHGGSNGYINVVGTGSLQLRHGGTNHVTLTSQGKLGIGTDSPGAVLSVNGGVHIGGTSDPGDNNLQIDGTVSFGTTTRQMLNLWSNAYGIGVQSNTLYFRTGYHYGWYKGGGHSNGDLDPGGGTTLMKLFHDGSLHVSGPTYNDSDITLKQDITPLEDILTKVKDLKPCSYRREADAEGRLSHGFIAQEVEQILPELVLTVDGKKALNYNAFGVLAIAALQEQHALIEELQTRLVALEGTSKPTKKRSKDNG